MGSILVSRVCRAAIQTAASGPKTKANQAGLFALPEKFQQTTHPRFRRSGLGRQASGLRRSKLRPDYSEGLADQSVQLLSLVLGPLNIRRLLRLITIHRKPLTNCNSLFRHLG